MNKKKKEAILENLDWVLTNKYLYNTNDERLLVCHCLFTASALLNEGQLEDLGLDLILELIKSNYGISIIKEEAPIDKLVKLTNYIFFVSETMGIEVDIYDLLSELQKRMGRSSAHSLDNLLFQILIIKNHGGDESNWAMIFNELSNVSVNSLDTFELITYLIIILNLGYLKHESTEDFISASNTALKNAYEQGATLENRVYSLVFYDIVMRTDSPNYDGTFLCNEILKNATVFMPSILENHFCLEYISRVCGNKLLLGTASPECEDLFYSKVFNQTTGRLGLAFLIWYEYLKRP